MKEEKSLLRLEDHALLTGRGRFVDDIQLPDMLHVSIFRSEHAHAALLSMDVDRASKMPGVVKILTFKELRECITADRLVVALPSKAFRLQVDRPVLAIDEVTYVGEPVAAVIAETKYQAEDACAEIVAEYDILPAVTDCESALKVGGATVHRSLSHNVVAKFDMKFGDVELAFRTACRILSANFNQARGGGHSIECRGNVALYDPIQEHLTVWSSTQTPHASMRMLAELLGCDEQHVRVITPDVGGAFGPKLVFYSEELIVAVAARMLGRPVKWIESRGEHFISATQEREQVWKMEVAVASDGRILGLRGNMVHDHGAYTARGVNVAFEAMQALTMPYDIASCDLQVSMVLTNKVPVTPVRGAGQPQGVFAMERLLDLVSRELGLDRAEVRLRNLIRCDQMPYTKPFKTRGGVPVVLDTGDFPLCQRKAMTTARWDQFKHKKEIARTEGRCIGIGIANFVELTGRGPFEPATVKVGSNGRIYVTTSAAAMGQGLRTALAQIVARQLGGDIKNIDVVTGDSSTSTTGFGGFGSRQTVTAGSSAHIAAIKIREKALKIAGHLLEVSAEDLDILGNKVFLKGAPGVNVSLATIAKASLGIAGNYLPAGLPPGLEASESFVVNEMTYSNGTAIAEVEVDLETGKIKILDYVMAHDCGSVINPMLVDGQIMGGIAHGIGNALMELMVFDKFGQPLTGSLMDYALPIATDIPEIRLEHHSSPTYLNPLGVKGVGEAGTLPTPAAIISAIEDALDNPKVFLSVVPLRASTLFEQIALCHDAQRLKN
ncbi:MAG: xanthine dehydrogenase family protein molybdopterin-binding subunit [Betaproteobacteria bacterium]